MIFFIFVAVFSIIVLATTVRRLFGKKSTPKNRTQSENSNEPTEISSEKRHSNEQNVKKFTKHDLKTKKSALTFTHPWLVTTLKGHSGQVLDFDFSPNGKYLATCSDDRSIQLWHTVDFEEKEHKTIRGNVDFDHATKICFAPDSKSLITCTAHDNKLSVFKIAKKDDGQGGQKIVPVDGAEFPANVHKADIINIGISCNGKFLMSASSDTILTIWDLKGHVLKIVDTKQGENFFAKVSPCGRFVACAGFTPDVKVWEVIFNKSAEFQDVVRAFELKGHQSGVRGFDFNQDSTKMVSCSKDGTFRVYKTDVEYTLGQEPQFLYSVHLQALRTAENVLVAMSPNTDTIGISADRIIKVYCTESGQELGEIDEHAGSLYSSGLKFSSDSKFLLSGRERHVRVFHNVAGYKVAARKYKEMVKKATTAAHKERLQQQADEAEEILSKFEKSA